MEGDRIQEVKEQIQSLPNLSAQRIQELRKQKEELIANIQKLRLANEEKEKDVQCLRNKVNVTKEKVAQLKTARAEMAEEKKELERRVGFRKEDIQNSGDMILNSGTSMLTSLLQNSVDAFQKYKEYKGFKSLQNGINTMKFRAEELSRQIENVEQEIGQLDSGFGAK